jgi:6-pyruvoyltetrahydropterin/6-carboxytetrahydropterin synthase
MRLNLKRRLASMPEFSLRLANDDLIFSAAHFITFEGGECEALHGHDYQLALEVQGPLNSQQYVVDFAVLHELLKRILKELDHRVLLAQKHPRIKIQTIGNELEVALGDRRWVLPKQDCLLLPVVNTTTEMLAQFLARRIFEELAGRKIAGLKYIRVELRESSGFTAICHSESDE